MTQATSGGEAARPSGGLSWRARLLLLASVVVATAAFKLTRRAQSTPGSAPQPGRERRSGEPGTGLLDDLAGAVPGLDPSRLRIDLRDGVAVLRGEVDWPEQRLQVERWLAERDGVLDVVSLLTLSGLAAPRTRP